MLCTHNNVIQLGLLEIGGLKNSAQSSSGVILLTVHWVVFLSCRWWANFCKFNETQMNVLESSQNLTLLSWANLVNMLSKSQCITFFTY